MAWRKGPGFPSSDKHNHRRVIRRAPIHCNTSLAEIVCSPTPCRERRSQQPRLPVPSIWSFIFIVSFVLVAIKSLVTFPFTLSFIEDIKIPGHFANAVLDMVFDVIYSYLTCLPMRNVLGPNLTDFMCTSLASFAINWVFHNLRMQIIIFELLNDCRALPLSVCLGYRPRLWPGNEWSIFALPSPYFWISWDMIKGASSIAILH